MSIAFLKQIMDKDNTDLIWLAFREPLKYEFEPYGAHKVLGVREKM